LPLNESSGVRRSNLTPQQRLEAEAAIFGLPAPPPKSERPEQREERERQQTDWARQILAQFDGDSE
jgi:hypothetical protein